MAMSVAEARTEIKTRLEQADLLEKKYPDPSTMPSEDSDQVMKLLTEVDDLEAKLVPLENAEQRRQRIIKDLDHFSKPVAGALRPSFADGERKAQQFSPGEQFVTNREYRALKQAGTFNSAYARVEFSVPMAEGTSLINWADALSKKTLLRAGSSTSGGAFVLEDHQPGMLDILQREINILDLIPRIPTTSDTVEYVSPIRALGVAA